MMSPDKRPHAVAPDARLTPVVRNPLDTSFREEFVYRGPDLQRANRQLATFLREVANTYRRIAEMPEPPRAHVVEKFLAGVVSPIVMCAGALTSICLNVFGGMVLVGLGFALKELGQRSQLSDEYCSLLQKIESTRDAFKENFRNPMKAALTDEQEPLGSVVMQYAIMGVAALLPETFHSPQEAQKLWRQLQRARFPLHVSFKHEDRCGPKIVKSEKFTADLKTLELLARLFEAAANFSLNGYDSERRHFEVHFRDLQAHLDASTWGIPPLRPSILE